MNISELTRNSAFLILLIICTLLLSALSLQPLHARGMNTVTIETASGPVEWTVELASDDASRSRGLMYRKSMDKRAGMLFRFDQTRGVSMWMKNTFIPLDMIFASEAGRITHIHRGAVPRSEEIISSQGAARYVLEVNAGEADETGLKVGDQMKHPWFAAGN